MNLNKICFFDIETASGVRTYSKLSNPMKKAWDHIHNTRYSKEDMTPAKSYKEKSALHAEFGRIVCISVGAYGVKGFHVKSYYGENEKLLISEFVRGLKKTFSNPKYSYLCGHNIRGFDVPYIVRRMMVNGLDIPEILNVVGKKPWETKHLIDTQEMWGMGQFKYRTSVKVLAAMFGIPTPKDDIDGSMVSSAYWKGETMRIATYCEKDVVATARIYHKMVNKTMDSNIIYQTPTEAYAEEV